MKKFTRHPFEGFPENHVRCALEAALRMQGDPIDNAYDLCERWRLHPYLPDCPPASGRINMTHSQPSLQRLDHEMTRLSAVIEKLKREAAA